jgi:predicted dehydrogenase
VIDAKPIRWAILGTAGIARRTFIPSLKAVGGGVPALVAARDADRARQFAAEHGIQRSVGGYPAAIADPEIDAVYIPLPNSLHAEWTIAALEAGKAVLSEKPLCATLEETERVLSVSRRVGRPVWEAIAFPFRSQTARFMELLADGVIGEVREVQSAFHFTIQPGDIRLSPELAGGALADVGCYPIRLARMIFNAEAIGVRASQRFADSGVDDETWGIVDFPGDRRLLFSCGFAKAYSTMARVLGTAGEMRISMPYAGYPSDTITILRPDAEPIVEHAVENDPQFAGIVRHVHEALTGAAPARHLATEDAAGNAAVIDAVRRSAATAPEPVTVSAP